ncbi:transglycosylase SLT domain-containing protein [Kineosporia babensis]|uniref:Transglycosylase SLT domain-containing protein n=1 Tax=Kineosporia babensis TaxID=499548 RepID=A0A9X1SSP7_9ACTN|nr:transglycosylase SLT domain-containing protein [Kineosporia babensis]MCD5309835.1 transglycosylase SLT domain-containing protein [Kineosporia babensis]
MSEGMSAVLGRISQIESLINPQRVSAAPTTSTAAPAETTEFDDLVDLVNGTKSRTGAPASESLADKAISIAKQYLGVAYKWGGNDPETGLDCSGFTRLVFGQLGVQLPRTSAAQATVGTKVSSLAAARPGDLLFFNSPVSHVGIYLGEGKMIDAPKAGDVVRIRDVYETPSQIRRVLNAPESSGPDPLARTLAQLNGSSELGSTPYAKIFEAAGKKYGLDPALLSAVARTESNYNASARSPAGALGLMQIMPGTARELGVDPMVPAQAVDGAARYLSDQLRTFGRVDLALAAYNAGPGAVRKYDGVPPYNETENYVRRVQNAWGQLR